jgi:hypothetical protein
MAFAIPWTGRQLRGFFNEAGLVDSAATPFGVTSTDDTSPLGRATRLAAEQALDAGITSSAEATEWLRLLDRRVGQGNYLVGICNFAVTGRKP